MNLKCLSSTVLSLIMLLFLFILYQLLLFTYMKNKETIKTKFMHFTMYFIVYSYIEINKAGEKLTCFLVFLLYVAHL